MLITLTILLAATAIYAIAVSKLYAKKVKEALKYYKFWTGECHSVIQQSQKIGKLNDEIDELKRNMAAKDREIDNLKGQIASEKYFAMTWRERARTFKENAEEYKKKYFKLLGRLS